MHRKSDVMDTAKVLKYAAIIAAIVFASYGIIYFLESNVTKFSSPDKVTYWLQVLSGNWSPGDVYLSNTKALSVAATVAIFINLGALYFLVNMAYRIVIFAKENAMAMKLQDVYTLRDMSIRNSIVAHILKITRGDSSEDIEKIIDQCFKEGHEVWEREHLSAIFTEKEAAAMREILNRSLVGAKAEGLQM